MAKQPYKMTKLSEIKPYEKNPRIIPQAAVDAVAKSIRAFGFRQPIVVDGDGVILAGHTRYRAAQQLGLSEVPVVWQTDISAIQARGYRIADNKTAELSAWDRDALDTEVKDIAAHCDADLDALGLADWEIQRILQSATDAYLLPETPIARTYNHGDRQILNDSNNNPDDSPVDVEPRVSSVLLIFQSPDEREDFCRIVHQQLSEIGRIFWSDIRAFLAEGGSDGGQREI